MPCVAVAGVHLLKSQATPKGEVAEIEVVIVEDMATDHVVIVIEIVTADQEVIVVAVIMATEVDTETDLAEIATVHVVAGRNCLISHILEGTFRMPSIFLLALSDSNLDGDY